MIENIFPIDEQTTLARARSRAYQTKSVHPKLVEEALLEGWVILKAGKMSVRLQRPKPLSSGFEDRVWTLLYRMQFELLSGAGGGKLLLNLKDKDGPTNQLDVVALDSELVIGIECKSSEKFAKRPQFQEELAKFSGFKERLSKAISSQWPTARKRQTSLIFFTFNINLSENDRERARQANILLFDEKDLEYYEKLVSQIGPAAKYQFLADMLPGKTVAGLEIKVPAVKTKMGPYNCYTFPISPEYLLKIAYVSHRTKGRASDINTYQRMIAKSRLKAIKQYITDKGIFPTNIVVNLEKKCVDFQRVKQENEKEEADTSGILGWLHLRPAYKSAWIIDGQHRLFSYSGHPRAKSGHLTVLAFEGIPPSAQARLFVDINAKQKSVKTSLLQELYAELNWDAEDPAIRTQAIVSKAVQILDSDKDSPLYERIRTADSTKDGKRCISLASVYGALEKQNFYIIKASKGHVIETGPLWAGTNEDTLVRTTTVIKGWLNTVRSGAPEWWDLGSGEGGGFAMNDSVTACINVLKSVLAHLETNGRNLHQLTSEELVEAAEPYALELARYFGSLTLDERKRFRDLRGVQGQTARTRRCQQAIREKFPKFNPPGLDDYIKNEKEQTNLKAKQVIDKIELLLKRVILDELKQEHTTDANAWWQEGVPKPIRLEVAKRQESDDRRRGEREAYFDLIDYRSIALANWQIFQNLLGYGRKSESKDKQTKWIAEVNELRNQVAHASSGAIVRLESLVRLEEYEDWLRKKVASVGNDDDGTESEAELSEA